MDEQDELFSVVWFDQEGYSTRVATDLPAENAVRQAFVLSRWPALPGKNKIARIIITDWGDNTVFEWKDGEVTFPR
jgi:hypothetical protein